MDSINPLDSLMRKIHDDNVKKGFWDNPKRSFGESIALIHSELSEALEEDRAGSPDLYIKGENLKPEGVAVELVDALIRILDLLGSMGIHFTTGLTLDELVDIKLDYNKTRPHKHGKTY